MNAPIDSVNTVLTVPELETPLRFFEEFCGFERFRDWDAEHSRGVILRSGEGAELELIAPPTGESFDGYSSGVQVSLNTPDADAWHDAVVADGRFPIVDPIADRDFGVRSFGIGLMAGLGVYVVQRLG